MRGKSKKRKTKDERNLQNLEFNSPTRLANELMFAKHSMTENEIKLWLITIASLSRTLDLDVSTKYEYRLSHLANLLNLNKDSSWRSMIRAIIDRVSAQTIKIMRRYSNDENLEHWIRMPMYNSVEYNDYADTVAIKINQEMLPYLQSFTEKFTEVEISEMLSLRGLVALKVYMVAKELASEESFTIPIEKLKRRLNMEKQYPEFRTFQRDVLSRAEKEIRRKTSMKFFHFSHNGRGRKAATHITIHFTEGDPTTGMPAVTPEKPVEALDPVRQYYYERLLEAGIYPEKAAQEILTVYGLKVVQSNYEYYLEKIQDRDPTKGPLRGGYLVNAIKNDYAKGRRRELVKLAEARRRGKMQEAYVDMEKRLDGALKQSREVSAHMIKCGDMGKLRELFDTLLLAMHNTAENLGRIFDDDKALVALQRRDLRTREMTIFREQIAQRLMMGAVHAEYVFE